MCSHTPSFQEIRDVSDGSPSETTSGWFLKVKSWHLVHACWGVLQ